MRGVSDIVVVAALKEELAPLRRARLPHPVALACLGDGAAAASKALTTVLDARDAPPAIVLVTGFCGALDPICERNTPVAVTRLVAIDRDPVPAPDPDWTARLTAAGARAVTLCSAGALISGRDERTALGTITGADVVDLESASLARICASRSIPFAVLRVVTDGIDDDLHPHVLAAARPDGSVSRPGVALRALVTPWTIPSLMKVARNARQAAEIAAALTIRVAASE